MLSSSVELLATHMGAAASAAPPPPPCSRLRIAAVRPPAAAVVSTAAGVRAGRPMGGASRSNNKSRLDLGAAAAAGGLGVTAALASALVAVALTGFLADTAAFGSSSSSELEELSELLSLSCWKGTRLHVTIKV